MLPAILPATFPKGLYARIKHTSPLGKKLVRELGAAGGILCPLPFPAHSTPRLTAVRPSSKKKRKMWEGWGHFPNPEVADMETTTGLKAKQKGVGGPDGSTPAPQL